MISQTAAAATPEYATIKSELARWLPRVNAPDSPSERASGEGPLTCEPVLLRAWYASYGTLPLLDARQGVY